MTKIIPKNLIEIDAITWDNYSPQEKTAIQNPATKNTINEVVEVCRKSGLSVYELQGVLRRAETILLRTTIPHTDNQ